MKIPDLISENDNFWELNPSFKFIFDKFYKRDRSKDKNKTSKLMWAIHFKVHPKSDFYKLPNKDDIIKTKWLKDKSFDWEDIKEQEDLYISSILTQAEKSLLAWEEMMKKRDTFIHSQDFTLDDYDENNKLIKGTAEQLDRMLANTGKLYSEYFKIRKEIIEDDIKRGKGNKPMSMSDSNEI